MKKATQKIEKFISVANTAVVVRRLRRSIFMPGCKTL
jgi:hypothetical protein